MGYNKRILLVDDNSVNLSILEEILQDEFCLKYARNGVEALEIAKDFRPAIVLLDVMMPGMDGLEACRKLRIEIERVHTAIVLVSAKAMPSERAEGFEAGADDYITKPFDEVELLQTIRRHIRQSSEFADTEEIESLPEVEPIEVC